MSESELASVSQQSLCSVNLLRNHKVWNQHIRVRVEHHSIIQMYRDASADTEIRVEKKISNDRLHNFDIFTDALFFIHFIV